MTRQPFMEHSENADDDLLRYAAAHQKFLSYIAEHTGMRVFDIMRVLTGADDDPEALISGPRHPLSAYDIARVREIAARCLAENPNLADDLGNLS